MSSKKTFVFEDLTPSATIFDFNIFIPERYLPDSYEVNFGLINLITQDSTKEFSLPIPGQ